MQIKNSKQAEAQYSALKKYYSNRLQSYLDSIGPTELCRSLEKYRGDGKKIWPSVLINAAERNSFSATRKWVLEIEEALK